MWISYGLGTSSGFSTPAYKLNYFGTGAGSWMSNNVNKRDVADLDGDGLSDIIGFADSGIFVSYT